MKKSEIIEKILQGKILIYPTDTLYGLGCNAMNTESVQKIREIKGRDFKPLSVIAPNFDWIYDNFSFNFNIRKYLPGNYTLLLEKKFPEFMNHISNNERVGIRVPTHPFTKTIQKAQVPFITTSVNLSSQPPALSLGDIPKEIIEKVDLVIEGKGISGIPSILIKDGEEVKRC